MKKVSPTARVKKGIEAEENELRKGFRRVGT
jgi:hypothetical protein